MKKGGCVLISEEASGQGRFTEEMGLLEREKPKAQNREELK